MRTETHGGCSGEGGVGIILVMLSILVLSVLTAGIIFTARTGVYSSYNYRMDTQAAYVADAGLQAALNWFKNSYSPASPSLYNLGTSPVRRASNGNPVTLDGINGSYNYPDSTIQTSFVSKLVNQTLSAATTPPSNGSFSVSATLSSARTINVLGKGPTLLERWSITSRGKAGAGIAETSGVITRFTQGGLPNYAAFGCSSGPAAVTIGDSSGGVNGGTDSYDSGVGPYNAATATQQGNAGTNGQLILDGGHIKGNAYYGSMTGSGTITGSSSVISPPYDCTTIPLPTTLPGAADQTFGGGSPTLDPGSYHNVLCSSACNLGLNPGTYNMNSLEVDSGSHINISGPTVINIVGTDPVSNALILDSDTVVNSGPPANLQILVNRTESIVADSGTSASYVLIAPKSNVVNDSNTSTYGLIIGKTIVCDSGAQIHYDLALQRGRLVFGISEPQLASWQRGTF